MTQRTLLTGTGLIIAVVLFFAVNVLSNAALTSARLDLTENDLYTLSPGVENVLSRLEEPITLRLYLSRSLAPLLPGISGYALRVKELLAEFEQAAGGRLRLEVIDPEPFSEDEDRAVGYGLQGVPIGEGDTLFYFGLVGTSAIGEEEVISFFQPDREEFLEYDLAKLVTQLANPTQKAIGLISFLPLGGSPPSPFAPGGRSGQPWVIYDHIEQLFNVRPLPPETTTIPEGIDVLMLVHPKNLGDPTLYAIDQFVLKGGRALIFVDPHAEADQPGLSQFGAGGGGAQRSSDLPALFDAWGVEMLPGKVIGDLTFARRVQFRRESRMAVADYPVWMELPGSQFAREDIVTADLQTLSFATPGAISKIEGRETEFVPLIETDDQAMAINVGLVQFATDVASLLQSYRPDGESYTLAARIRGKVRSAFPGGPPKEPAGEKSAATAQPSPPPHIPESQGPINVIVVADTDLLQDYFWVQVQSFLGQRIGIPTASNGAFVANALDNLSGSNDLIGVRTRGGYKRPFTMVRGLQQQAEREFRQVEQELLERKRATERKIQELQANRPDGGALILSAEQEQELERFRQELIEIRADLRRVQRELHRNIDRLDSWLKFLNIGLMPLLIGLFGLAISVRNGRRRGAAKPSTTSP